MEQALAQTPLELLARAASRPLVERSTARKLFDSYDRFLGILDDPENREELDGLTEDAMATSAVWGEIRGLSHKFHFGLVELFFGKDQDLRELSAQYGVF